MSHSCAVGPVPLPALQVEETLAQCKSTFYYLVCISLRESPRDSKHLYGSWRVEHIINVITIYKLYSLEKSIGQVLFWEGKEGIVLHGMMGPAAAVQAAHLVRLAVPDECLYS